MLFDLLCFWGRLCCSSCLFSELCVFFVFCLLFFGGVYVAHLVNFLCVFYCLDYVAHLASFLYCVFFGGGLFCSSC